MKWSAEIWAALNDEVLRADAGEMRWGMGNARVGETGDPRENLLTSDIVRHDSHVQKFGSDHAWSRPPVAQSVVGHRSGPRKALGPLQCSTKTTPGIKPGSPRYKASSLAATLLRPSQAALHSTACTGAGVVFFHWLLRRCQATPFINEPRVIVAHKCEAFNDWRSFTQCVSDTVWYNDRRIAKARVFNVSPNNNAPRIRRPFPAATVRHAVFLTRSATRRYAHARAHARTHDPSTTPLGSSATSSGVRAGGPVSATPFARESLQSSRERGGGTTAEPRENPPGKRHRLTRFPHEEIRECTRRAGMVAVVGGERLGHCGTAAPSRVFNLNSSIVFKMLIFNRGAIVLDATHRSPGIRREVQTFASHFVKYQWRSMTGDFAAAASFVLGGTAPLLESSLATATATTRASDAPLALGWLAILLPRESGAGAPELGGGAGDPREDPPTNGIVRHDFHMRKSGVTRPGIEPGSPWWEASLGMPGRWSESTQLLRRTSFPGERSVKYTCLCHRVLEETRGYSSASGATVAKRLARSPPTKANRVQSPAGGFSRVGVVPDDAVGRRAFSGISRFPRPFIPALLHTHLNHPHRLSRLLY
ncbi:hypothetical protein PR048_029129 [Dryococelus australis]|uniref:Uncharacterized protein n=1 Tax=Dryococelus australis TaxID=614101 RepID=A0ABQ9GF48_9NEOP|nr:hypothetical protein PR048_029129 [Dryococelus australis]